MFAHVLALCFILKIEMFLFEKVVDVKCKMIDRSHVQLPQNDLRPANVSYKSADFVGFVALIKTIITFLNM